MIRTLANVTRDQDRLIGVHPELASAVTKILGAMDELGFGMMVTEGLRSDARQAALYAQGRTTPGKIVTNADGVNDKSKHQKQEDGWGHAVDSAFLDDPTTAKVETYDENMPWELYALAAEKLGLTAGYRWRSPHDPPHVEKR